MKKRSTDGQCLSGDGLSSPHIPITDQYQVQLNIKTSGLRELLTDIGLSEDQSDEGECLGHTNGHKVQTTSIQRNETSDVDLL
jgi:hypothetical protein